jgi:AraC-like DNA-binding protein
VLSFSSLKSLINADKINVTKSGLPASFEITGGALSLLKISLPAGLHTVPPCAAAIHFRPSGKAQVFAGANNEHVLFAGAYIFVPAEQSLHIRTTGIVERWCVLISAPDSLMTHGIKLPTLFQTPRHDAALACFFELLGLHLQNQEHISNSFIDIFERLLVQQFGYMFAGKKPAKLDMMSTEQLLRLGEYVDARLQHNLSVHDLSRQLDISRFQLLRILRKTLDLTPQQFLMHRRIDCAKNLLGTSNTSLSDIAHMTGFSSQSHFTNAFGDAVGMSPRAYRMARTT